MMKYVSNCLFFTLIFTLLLVDVKTFKITNEKRISRMVNDNHFPEFKSCSSYNPRIKEEQPPGTPVLTVVASDLDPPEAGGTVTYELIDSSELFKFDINQTTGEITTKSILNRDEPDREKEFELIVRAIDNGKPQLQDICLFTVTVEDINDNSPVFDKTIYKEYVPKDKEMNSDVMRISATDIDDGLNKEVEYALNGSGGDYDFFNINPKTGVVKLAKEITRPVGYVFRIQASASDKNPDETKSSIVELEITVIESKKEAPAFDTDLSGEIFELRENFTSITENIATLKAKLKPGEQAPVFTLLSGMSEDTNSRGTFVLRTNGKKDTAFIRLSGNVRLDYEMVKEYTLTVRIENKHSLAATQLLKIKILDVNDIAPRFEKRAVTGQVFENESPGTFVTKVQAVDGDVTPEFRKITYELGDSTELFAINPESGVITTKKEFDRETKESYNVKVIANDGAPSALTTNGEPNTVEQVFRFHIADKNDNSPNFEKDKYTVVISKNAAVNSVVTEVKATDADSASQIVYSIVGGNEDGIFEILPGAGVIKTKLALDWVKKTLYLLEIKADDGSYSAKCLVEIKVANVNENGPLFNHSRLGIVIEEKALIPGCIVTVEAYDPDLPRNEDQKIVYSLLFAEQQEFFRIDANGCVSLVKPLHRDPPNGRGAWVVMIKANDDAGNPSTTKFNVAEIKIHLRDRDCLHPPCAPQPTSTPRPTHPPRPDPCEPVPPIPPPCACCPVLPQEARWRCRPLPTSPCQPTFPPSIPCPPVLPNGPRSHPQQPFPCQPVILVPSIPQPPVYPLPPPCPPLSPAPCQPGPCITTTEDGTLLLCESMRT